MRKKIEFYGDIQGEAGVIMAFSKIHEQLGFNKLVPSTSRGFDIDSIDYHGHDVTLEFEYMSSSFINHGHPAKMQNDRKYVVICYEDDCGLKSKLKDEYGKTLYDLITIRKYIQIKENIGSAKKNEEPLYALMSYNPDMAGGKDFSAWAFANCYRVSTSEKTPKFAGDKLPPGSKLLFSQDGYIIGGFTVVRYEIIDEPKTKREWIMYKKLTDYPASLYTVSIDDYKEYWYRGHIFYTDFFDLRDFKVKVSHFIDTKMPRQGKSNLTKEKYDLIMGR